MKKYNIHRNLNTEKNLKYRTKNNGETLMDKKIKNVREKGQDSIENKDFTANLHNNINLLKDIFRGCFDFVVRDFIIDAIGRRATIAYMNGMIDKDIINEQIIGRLLETNINVKSLENIKDVISSRLISTNEYKWLENTKQAVDSILNGECILIVDGINMVISLPTQGMEIKGIGEAQIESTIRGSQEAFSETLDISLTQLRRKLRTSQLKMKTFELGKYSKTRIVVAYIKGIADDNIVKEVEQKIRQVELDVILDVGQLQSFFENSSYSPFPQIEFTQRPDSSVAGLAEGRVVLLMDGTPFVLIVPTTFTYLFTSPEDYYNRFYFASFIRVIRYISFFTTLFGPALYVAITNFHPEMLPSSLLITVANARADVPFPAMVEALLMELIFEIIREAGARQPKNIGQALNIVGALVIGQLSVQAGLVSPAMIIVVSVTGLSSFLIPKVNSSREISTLRFPMIILGGIFGIFGLIMSLLALLIHMVSLESFGVPYMSPMAPTSFRALKDTILKPPQNMIKKASGTKLNNNSNKGKDSEL